MVGGLLMAWRAYQLYELVVEDRNCPQAAAMDRKFLEDCI